MSLVSSELSSESHDFLCEFCGSATGTMLCCDLGKGFFFFSALKWIHPNSTILLFFPSPFAEMMVLQREGPE